MIKINADFFIDTYEYLYYEPNSIPEGDRWRYYGAKNNIEVQKEYKSKLNKILNISSLNGTDYNAEQEIEKLLSQGIFNKYSLAWKSGRIEYEKDQLVTHESFESDRCYRNGYGKKIEIGAFDKYCLEVEKNKNQIKEHITNNEWEEAYRIVMEVSPENIGPVYNINTLFFLTGGKAPIYDSFAHKAVKAILLNISPDEVYMGENPNKNEVEKVVLMYREYMIMLKMVFTDYLKTRKADAMFIPRALDRALWVYGHAKKICQS